MVTKIAVVHITTELSRCLYTWMSPFQAPSNYE